MTNTPSTVDRAAFAAACAAAGWLTWTTHVELLDWWWLSDEIANLQRPDIPLLFPQHEDRINPPLYRWMLNLLGEGGTVLRGARIVSMLAHFLCSCLLARFAWRHASPLAGVVTLFVLLTQLNLVSLSAHARVYAPALLVAAVYLVGSHHQLRPSTSRRPDLWIGALVGAMWWLHYVLGAIATLDLLLLARARGVHPKRAYAPIAVALSGLAVVWFRAVGTPPPRSRTSPPV